MNNIARDAILVTTITIHIIIRRLTHTESGSIMTMKSRRTHEPVVVSSPSVRKAPIITRNKSESASLQCTHNAHLVDVFDGLHVNV
jgi:hypothetical protein